MKIKVKKHLRKRKNGVSVVKRHVRRERPKSVTQAAADGLMRTPKVKKKVGPGSAIIKKKKAEGFKAVHKGTLSRYQGFGKEHLDSKGKLLKKYKK